MVTERQVCCGEFNYRVSITLADSAPRGAQIGTVDYSEGLSCGGILRAMRATGDVYEVEENITSGSGCVSPVTLFLTHDFTTETLAYRFGTSLNGGTAVLERDE